MGDAREADFEWALLLLAMQGRIVLVSGREARSVLPVGPFYAKDYELHGFAMFNYSSKQQRHCGEDLNRWFAESEYR